MLQIEKYISPLVEKLFPQFYLTEGETFVAFIKAYYEWLEQNFQLLTLESVTGFSVGETIYQIQATDRLASGVIYSINDNDVLVLLDSIHPFRCIMHCSELSEIYNSTGSTSKIMVQEKPNPLFSSRNLFEYRDVDTTIDNFILFFKEKYLKNIQFNIATNKELLIKNSLELYRSKGTERSIDLFFKLVYNKIAQVYYPGEDIFKLSDGDWVVPQYLEISYSPNSVDFVGKIITGMDSEATAFVEKLVKRKLNTGYVNVFYISNITGEFIRGESLKVNTFNKNNPKVLGSLNELEVISRGSNYEIGDIVNIENNIGVGGKAKITETTTTTGEVEFIFNSGGYGYSVSPIEYLSDKIITISNLITTDTSSYFKSFENFTQKLANISFSSISSNSIALGSNLYMYHGNGSLMAQGIILEANISPIFELTVNTAANSTVLLTLSSGNTDDISVGDLIVGSTNTAVINTDVSSKVTSIVNSSTFIVNSDIIIANGTSAIAVSSTGAVAEFFVYVLSGDFSTGNSYTVSNTISGQINSILDKTISSKIIKASNTLILSVSNAVGTFDIGSNLYQSNGTAIIAYGTINNFNISGGIGSIELGSYSGIFDTSYSLEIENGAICNLESFSTTLAIQYNREKNVEVTVNTTANSTTLLSFTSGNTSLLQPGDQLYLSSNSLVVSNSSSFISTIINSTAVSMSSNVIVSNGISTITFLDITDNDLVTNTAVFCNTEISNTSFIIDSISLGSGADYSLVNVETSEEVFINTDLLGSNNISNVPYLSIGLESSAYGFPRNPTANSSSYLIEALNFSLLQVGSITDVITSNPGQDYTLAPIAVIVEPSIAALNLKDYIITIEEIPGTIKVGDIITQNVGNATQTILTVANVQSFLSGELVYQGPNLAFSTANAIVYFANTTSNKLSLVDVQGTFAISSNLKSYVTSSTENVSNVESGVYTSEIARGEITQSIFDSNSSLIYVKRLSIPSFQISGNTITNELGYSANIIAVNTQIDSTQIGLNANVETNVIISEGAVSKLEILDSGFAYPNNSVIEFSGSNTQESGTARTSINNYGKGSGYYRSSKGFLSEDKYIFDGDYYQEYSYEVISSISFDKYSDVFKKVMHVAGTKVFGSVVLQSESEVKLSAVDEVEVKIGLNELTGTFTLSENAAIGAVAGTLSGQTPGSTLTIYDDAESRVSISGNSIIKGSGSLNYEANTYHTFIVKEELSNSAGPIYTTLTLNVTNVYENANLQVLTLSNNVFLAGIAANGTILNTTNGSSIVANGLPSGLSINTTAKTWSWDGSNTITVSSNSFTITESLSDSENSPVTTTIYYSGTTISLDFINQEYYST